MTESSTKQAGLPFKGVKVIELGTVIAGPFAASLLADLGATIIKIEAPGAGDALRHMGPSKGGVPIWWGVSARAKQCITLDLKSEDGKAHFRRLVADADVLIENFRPGVMDRLGIGWETLHKFNPQLVLLSISGFGNTGPLAQRPGFGKIAESLSGLVSLTGKSDERPLFVGFSLADTSAGLFGALGVAVALYSRDVCGGKGARIDLALYEPILRMLDRQFIDRMARGADPVRGGTQDPYGYGIVGEGRPHFRTARSKDGLWLMLMVPHDAMSSVADLVGTSDPLSDGGLADWIGQQPSCAVREALVAAGVSIVPVLDGAMIARMPYFQTRGDVREINLPKLGRIKVPGSVSRPGGRDEQPAFRAPEFGADTDIVLCESGAGSSSDADIATEAPVRSTQK